MYFWGNEVDGEADSLHCAGGGWAYGGDAGEFWLSGEKRFTRSREYSRGLFFGRRFRRRWRW